MGERLQEGRKSTRNQYLHMCLWISFAVRSKEIFLDFLVTRLLIVYLKFCNFSLFFSISRIDLILKSKVNEIVDATNNDMYKHIDAKIRHFNLWKFSIYKCNELFQGLYRVFKKVDWSWNLNIYLKIWSLHLKKSFSTFF